MRRATTMMIFVSTLLSAAIFGFFYAWVCSTMWGLDAAAPDIAIKAMQAMNASVRNIVFAPAFFGTPFALALTALLLFREAQRASALCFALAGLVSLCFCMLLTMGVNVPMNEALAQVSVPQDSEAARRIWADYSGPWQVWNQARTLAAGLAFLLAIAGLVIPWRKGATA